MSTAQYDATARDGSGQSTNTGYGAPPSTHAADSSLASSADSVVSSLHSLDEKVNDMRSQFTSNPDSAGDRLIKSALPMLAGLIAGKLFKMVWDHTVVRSKSEETLDQEEIESSQQQGMWMSVLFAGFSAAFGAVVSELSTRGSAALVAHRQNRRSDD